MERRPGQLLKRLLDKCSPVADAGYLLAYLCNQKKKNFHMNNFHMTEVKINDTWILFH